VSFQQRVTHSTLRGAGLQARNLVLGCPQLLPEAGHLLQGCDVPARASGAYRVQRYVHGPVAFMHMGACLGCVGVRTGGLGCGKGRSLKRTMLQPQAHDAAASSTRCRSLKHTMAQPQAHDGAASSARWRSLKRTMQRAGRIVKQHVYTMNDKRSTRAQRGMAVRKQDETAHVHSKWLQ